MAVMERQSAEHISVMADEVLEYLRIKPHGVYVDATLGLGGHFFRIIQQIEAGGRLIGFDQDAEALEKAQIRLKKYTDHFQSVHSNFRFLKRELNRLGIDSVDGFIFDLGVSSLQIDSGQRGFSFQSEGPLDMRMDQQLPRCAADLVAELPEDELARIIYLYGEDRFSRRIARRIVSERQMQPIRTTEELSRIVCRAVPSGRKWQKLHPATRTFQALRVVVNDELGSLKEGLSQALELLNSEGRICVIAFHSLEDRIVKTMFKEKALSDDFDLPFKRPLRPGPDEEHENPRSRSARMRVIERR